MSQILNLEDNNTDSDGAKHLARNGSWKFLQTLNLLYNSIGADGSRAVSN